MERWKLEGYEPFKRGKVRDLYAVPDRDDLYCIVTTDRISVNDKVIGEIPLRGEILQKMSNHWKSIIEGACIIENDIFLTDFRKCLDYFRIGHWMRFNGRIMIVRKAIPLPIECIVRGYIAGSLWKEYQQEKGSGGKYLDNYLPDNLRESEKFPEPIFTPTTKEIAGVHDQPIEFGVLVCILEDWAYESGINFERSNFPNGKILAEKIKSISLEIYSMASRMIAEKGMILADTKFEFGFVWNEPIGIWDLRLIDEVITPDCSRFWSLEDYVVGEHQKSFDKQFLRDQMVADPDMAIPERLQISLHAIYDETCRIICE